MEGLSWRNRHVTNAANRNTNPTPLLDTYFFRPLFLNMLLAVLAPSGVLPRPGAALRCAEVSLCSSRSKI